MIAGLVGRAFRLIGRIRGGEAGRDLEQVGRELADLERRAAQRPTTSR